jgi:hypothetical protein
MRRGSRRAADWGTSMRSTGSATIHATRVLAATAGLLVLFALQPANAPRAASPVHAARALILSEQARRYLTLQYRSYSTEFMGCMLGKVRGRTVIVDRIAPADVDPAASAPTHVVPKETCEAAGWTGTVGMIHSHPAGERCWYYFPSTSVATSDGQSFVRQAYAVDAIMCGDRVVWISRDMSERQVALTAPSSAGARPRATRGNQPQNSGVKR